LILLILAGIGGGRVAKAYQATIDRGGGAEAMTVQHVDVRVLPQRREAGDVLVQDVVFALAGERRPQLLDGGFRIEGGTQRGGAEDRTERDESALLPSRNGVSPQASARTSVSACLGAAQQGRGSVPARCGDRFGKSSDSLRRTPPTSP